MSTHNEACLAWLEDALRRLRAEGKTKVVGYLEAVSDEVLFETRGDADLGVLGTGLSPAALEERCKDLTKNTPDDIRRRTKETTRRN